MDIAVGGMVIRNGRQQDIAVNPIRSSLALAGVTPSTSIVTPGGDPYDLTAGSTRTIPSIVSGYSWAAEPTTTQTVEVFSSAQLASELSSPNGKRIQIRGPGNGGTSLYQNTIEFNDNAFSDIWLEADTDAIIQPGGEGIMLGLYNAASRPSRIKITGGTWNSTSFYCIRFVNMDDLILDNVNMYATGNTLMIGDVINRFTCLNSTFRGGGTGFTWMSVPSFGRSLESVIIANMKVLCEPGSNNGPWRQWGGHNNFIMVDSYVDRNSANSHFRFTGDSENFWIQDNAFDDTSADDWAAVQVDAWGGTAGPPTPLGPGVINNNDMWIRTTQSQSQVISVDAAGADQGNVTGLSASGNRAYFTNTGGFDGSDIPSHGDVVWSDNLTYSVGTANYLPPVDPANYGADH